MARRKRRNKGSVHPALRNVYGNRARNLKDTILSLLPRSPNKCHCAGIGCLRCRGADHLLCQGDPTTYRHLITYAQCAVSSDAPAPPVIYSVRQLSQRQIVKNAMELMLRSWSCKDNLLCKSYDKHSCANLSVELLSSSDWSLLLDRIGELLMDYLLRHCSIFVPNGRSIKGFIQVTGTPLTSLDISKPSYAPAAMTHVLAPQHSGDTQTLSHVNSRNHIKRKRDEVTNNTSSQSSVCKLHKRKRLYSWQRRKQHKLINQHKACSQLVKENDSRACFRCFVLQSVPNLPADVLIKRQYIFYNRYSSPSLFPMKHILNLLKPNDCDAFSLIKNVFGNAKDYSNFLQCTDCGHHARSRSKCLYHSSLALFKSLIRDAQRCRHRMLLQKYCYVNSFNRDGHLRSKVAMLSLPATKMHQNKNKTTFCIANKEQTFETTFGNSKSNASSFSPQSFSKHEDVVSFIFASLRRIVPFPLLGNKKSWRMLRRNIYKFVQLRRHEKIFLEDCMEGLDVSNFEFFSNLQKSCSCDGGGKNVSLVKKLLFTWVHWLFLHIIMPIISSNFYVTERESKRYEVFYYKKPIWGCAVKGCIEKLKRQSFCPMDSESVRNIFNGGRCFGFSRIRFLPKENCLRPLASLNKPSKLHSLKKRYQSVNSSLNDLHVILKTIKAENPNLLGSSVFDYNDVYQKLHGFISKVKNGAFSMPEVFIVVADVSKAFDSIDQDKLLKIMEGIIQNKEYIVGNYRQVLSRKSCVSPVYKVPSLGSIMYNKGNYVSNPLVQFSSNSGLFVAQAVYKNKKKDVLQSLLTEHVKHNIVKIGRDLYEQKVGITQGSIISSLLCSFYLGHLEETLLWPYLEKLKGTRDEQASQSMLMRYLDDFIFVSTSKKQALGFFDRLRRGFRDYNCYMNCEKFGLNFEAQRGKFTNKRYVGEDGISFLPWSGLLVNCITLELQADYTRYWDIDIRSTITVYRSNKPGDLLQSKLFSYMLPKSYVMLYDSSINSPATVRLNAYQAFLLCAMKFHCYICEMHDSVPSPDELLKIIEKTCRYMYNLICKRVRDAQTCFGVCAVLRLKIKEIIWLGLFAFISVLKKKQSRHKDLLFLLRENIGKYDIWARTSYHLQYAVDASHSSMFWKIKY